MTRYFIFQDEKSQKFWNIELNAAFLEVTYGRIGTKGQSQTKTFSTAAECEKAAEKMIAEKVKKGYTEVTREALDNAKDEAKRFGLSYDDYWEDGKDNKYLFNKILNYKHLDTLKHMTIANWGGAFEGDNSQDMINWLIEHKADFQNLESFKIGDMEQEECELSWINQGSFGDLWDAYPELKHLVVQGSVDLTFGKIHSDVLESIEVICGGLPANIVREIAEAKTPHLKKINLYLGVDDYGYSVEKDDYIKLLMDSDFPKLEYLGLCNADYDALKLYLPIIIESKYASKIKTLNLSMSVFTDDCADILLNNASKLTNLKLLDLNYHYLTEAYMKKMQLLPFKVILTDRQEYDEREKWYNSPMFTE